MTDVKMPLPAHRGPSGTGTYFDSFTEAQLKQYGDDRAKEALEMAAKVCDAKADRVNSTWIPHECASQIRELAKELK